MKDKDINHQEAQQIPGRMNSKTFNQNIIKLSEDKILKAVREGVPTAAQWKQIQLVSLRMQVQSPAPLSGLRIWCCLALWYRLQTRFRSCIAVVVA